MNDEAKSLFSKSWDALKIMWQGGVTVVKRGWLVVTLSIALAGAAGYIWWMGHKQDVVESELNEVKAESERLRVQSEELVELNKKNAEVYSQLAEDRARMEQLVEGFNYQMRANVKILGAIGNKVGKLEDGQLAPVLRETIRELEKVREARDD